MRISTRQSFLNSVSNMQNSQSKLADLQNQISTGKKLNKPSDDPVAAAQVVKLNRELAQTEKYQENVDVTQRRLELEETVLTNLNNAIDRIKELTIQAGNGVLTNADRKSVATEIRGLVDYAAGLMNTQDAQGEYLFAGSKGFTKPYEKGAEGAYLYTGDDGQRMIQVAPDLYVPSSDSGQYLFEAASKSVTVEALSPALDNISNLSIIDEKAYEAFARGRGDLTLRVQAVPDSDTKAYQLQLLDSDDLPLALDENGTTIMSLPSIETGQTVQLYGMEFTVTPPDAAQMEVEFEQDGVSDLSVGNPVDAAAFFNQYGALELTFDGAGGFALTDSNNDPVVLPDQTYQEGETLVVGGFRLDVGTPEDGDSVTLSLPLPSLSAVESIDVIDSDALYSLPVSVGIDGTAPPSDFDFSSAPDSFTLTVDGTDYTLPLNDVIRVAPDTLADAELALNNAIANAVPPMPPGTVSVSNDGAVITLTSGTAALGSEVTISGMSNTVATALGFENGQTDYYANAATDVIANGGELTLAYDAASDAYYVDAPGYRLDNTEVSQLGISLNWDPANPPADGDTLTVKLPPHADAGLRMNVEKQNILDVAQELALALETPVSTPESKEALFTQIDLSLEKLNQVAERNIEARTRIGARVNSLEDTRTANTDFKLFTETALSSLEDVDFAEAVSELQLEQAILQAAQASFVRVSEMSLFNYLK